MDIYYFLNGRFHFSCSQVRGAPAIAIVAALTLAVELREMQKQGGDIVFVDTNTFAVPAVSNLLGR